MFKARLLNVSVGCGVGLGMLLLGAKGDWTIALGLALTVLIASYVVRVTTMWRQAPITAAIVIAAGISTGSTQGGIGEGLHKVGEVVFGCLVGLAVSVLMSKVWLVRGPAERAPST